MSWWPVTPHSPVPITSPIHTCIQLRFCLRPQVSSPTLEEAIRGFRVVRNETTELVFDKPGEYLIPEPAPAAPATAPAAEVPPAQQESAAADGPAAKEAQAATAAEPAAGSVGGGGGDGGLVAAVKEAAQADIFGA